MLNTQAPTRDPRGPVATLRLQTGITLVACLIALQWLDWWTFFVALALVTALGVRFYRRSAPNKLLVDRYRPHDVGHCGREPLPSPGCRHPLGVQLLGDGRQRAAPGSLLGDPAPHPLGKHRGLPRSLARCSPLGTRRPHP